MDFLQFLQVPLSKGGFLGFFSPEYLLRTLFYQKIKNEVKASQGEYHHYVFSELVSVDQITQSIGQGGLFASEQCHCIFFDESDFASSTQKKKMKALAPLTCVDTLPVFFLGDFILSAQHKKCFPAGVCWVDPPKLNASADLKRLYELLRTILGFDWLDVDQFQSYLHAYGGDLTRCFYDTFRLSLQKSIPHELSGELTDRIPIDLFSFSKKVGHPSMSLAEILQLFSSQITQSSDWYPLLGLLHKLIHSNAAVRRHLALRSIAVVDDALKHFTPARCVDQLFVFSIALLHRAFQGYNITYL